MLLNYCSRLSTGRLILWCYFIWYLVILVRYFDANLRLWLTSIGLAAIVGVALVISTRSSSKGTMALDRWQVFRLFLMPFCVSSFSALVKGREFVLIFSPRLAEDAIAAGLCLLLGAAVAAIKHRWPPAADPAP